MEVIFKFFCKYINIHHGEILYTHYGDDGIYEMRKCNSCGLEWKVDLENNCKKTVRL